MIDIHCHVLPGIDDGAPDLDESIEMARRAAESGVTALAATPHLRADFPAVRAEELADRCDRVRLALAEAGIGLEIITGAEVSLAWAIDAGDEQLRLASYGQRGTDVLVETPRSAGSTLPQLLYEVRRRGYRVTLAHPERQPEFQRNPELVEELAAQGVLLEVNADSILASPRRSPIARLARRLCLDGHATAVASDSHRATSMRPVTVLADARRELAQMLDGAAATWLTETAPAAIVAGEPVPDPPTRTQATARTLLGMMRRR